MLNYLPVCVKTQSLKKKTKQSFVYMGNTYITIKSMSCCSLNFLLGSGCENNIIIHK